MIKMLAIPNLILYLSTSCTKKGDSPFYGNPITIPETDTSYTDSASKTYLALGDSYTIGQSVAENDRYPNQTAVLLKADTVNMTNPEIIARTGWTTADLLTSINTHPPTKKAYSVVTLLIGVNNQYQHLPIEQYKEEFVTLLNKAIAYAGNKNTHVIVLSIPDYGITPFGKGSGSAGNAGAIISGEIDAYNVINKQLTQAAGCRYLDVTTASRDASNDLSLVAVDGLHYSGKEYTVWANMLAPLIKESLR